MVHVENITGNKIKTVFQDPAFTTSDKEFLASLGHEVVEAPAAMALVDEDAFVFGIHLYREVYAQALEKSLPAILIGTGYNVWEE
jgi:DNA-binding phage protein